jgi:hypothetical protein
MEETTNNSVIAMDGRALTTLGTFAHTDRKKDLHGLHSVVRYDVERKMMAVDLDRLAPYEGTAWDKWL